MTIKELHEMTFNRAAEALCEGDATITRYEDLKAFAKQKIDDDQLFLAIHILEAINKDPGDFYSYDYCMGTLETPTALLTISDLEDYCEEESEE